MLLQQLKEEAKKGYGEAVRYGNEEDFIDSLITKAYEYGGSYQKKSVDSMLELLETALHNATTEQEPHYLHMLRIFRENLL